MSDKNDPYGYPPRAMRKLDACRYLGIGVSLFDEAVQDGRLPEPKLFNSRLLWDRIALDVAFSALPDRQADTRSDLKKIIDRANAKTRLPGLRTPRSGDTSNTS